MREFSLGDVDTCPHPQCGQKQLLDREAFQAHIAEHYSEMMGQMSEEEYLALSSEVLPKQLRILRWIVCVFCFVFRNESTGVMFF